MTLAVSRCYQTSNLQVRLGIKPKRLQLLKQQCDSVSPSQHLVV